MILRNFQAESFYEFVDYTYMFEKKESYRPSSRQGYAVWHLFIRGDLPYVLPQDDPYEADLRRRIFVHFAKKPDMLWASIVARFFLPREYDIELDAYRWSSFNNLGAVTTHETETLDFLHGVAREMVAAVRISRPISETIDDLYQIGCGVIDKETLWEIVYDMQGSRSMPVHVISSRYWVLLEKNGNADSSRAHALNLMNDRAESISRFKMEEEVRVLVDLGRTYPFRSGLMWSKVNSFCLGRMLSAYPRYRMLVSTLH